VCLLQRDLYVGSQRLVQSVVLSESAKFEEVFVKLIVVVGDGKVRKRVRNFLIW